ncbi:SdiA-regulated domain-containing protein [bacterium]|nr:SdiA-regulated domain-containing protein [bacterium]
MKPNNVSLALLVSGISLLLLCCGSGNGDPVKPGPVDSTYTWVQIEEYDLTIPEPSGLVYDEARERFWIVSDNTGQLHALSKKGIVLQTLPWVGADLEAITIDPQDGSFYVTEERTAAVYHLDADGHYLNTFQFDSLIYGGNHGFEGISYRPDQDCLYLLKESDPGLLLRVDMDGTIQEEMELGFASDYSDLTSLGGDSLLVLSDEDESVTLIIEDGTILSAHDLEKISSPEGLALVHDTLYVVTDNSANLALYVRQPATD